MKRTTIKNSPHIFERPHICGIGGIGMSGVAHLLLDRGFKPTGSDLRQSELTSQLEMRGVQITYATCPEQIQPASCVIAPMAFPESHAEIQAARLAGIPVLRRASAIAQICSSSDCTRILCFGTTARGKLPWLFHKQPQFGRCAGSAIFSNAPVLHARFDQKMMIDIDEREFLCDSDNFRAFYGADVVVSDWLNDEFGYYQQKSFAQKYTLPPEAFLPQIRSRILAENAVLIAPDAASAPPSEIRFSAFSKSETLEQASFHLDPVKGILLAPQHWNLPAMPVFGTCRDACALAAALLWCRCRNISIPPEDVECIGWFHEIAPKQFHDIRMHPVNLRNALNTLKLKAEGSPVSIAIKPFGQTLDSYSLQQWQCALTGADRLLVILPPYEGCSEQAARDFANAMSVVCPIVETVTAEQARERISENEFRLWSGAGDIL